MAKDTDALEDGSVIVIDRETAQTESSKATCLAEFVPAAFASDLVEADRFRSVLEGHGVLTVFESENGDVAGIPGLSRGVPVLVPGDLLDEATTILGARRRRESEEEFEEDEEFEEEFEEEGEEVEDEDDLDEYEDEDFDDYDDEDDEEVFYEDDDEEA
jgi:hypothetical protein